MKLITLFFTLIFGITFSQKESNNWYFGENAGINFDDCTPTSTLNGALNSQEGTSCVSDKTTGEVLFYTNGVNVWGRNGTVMPNGSGLYGHASNTQVLIIPMPNSDDKYYIITTDLQGIPGYGLRYSVVDMSLNSGLGDVISLNILIHNPTVCEKLTATWHSNGTNIWVVGHEYGNNHFFAYEVSPNGISSTSVISSIGYVHTGSYDSRGEIRFSPNGMKLSNATNGDSNGICANELFDFDKTTGILSNCISLPSEKGGYGTCFSIDNSKLYFTNQPVISNSSTYSKIYQFDLASGNPVSIINSKYIIDSIQTINEGSYMSCYLGSNNKLYIARPGKKYLGVINFPYLIGSDCNFVKDGLDLGDKLCSSGTNNLISIKDSCSFNSNYVDENSNFNTFIYPNPTTNKIKISTGNNSNSLIEIYDLQGKLFYKVLINNYTEISCQNWSSGIYFVYIKNEIFTKMEKLILK